MTKIEKNKKFSKDILIDIPAYALFCIHELNSREPVYEWQSWGLVIKNLRDFANMDQDVFGRLLQGYTRGHISRYETEQSEPTIDFWIKMMRVFGLNINWAFTGKGNPYITEYQDCEERKRFYKWIQLISDKQDFLKELKGW